MIDCTYSRHERWETDVQAVEYTYFWVFFEQTMGEPLTVTPGPCTGGSSLSIVLLYCQCLCKGQANKEQSLNWLNADEVSEDNELTSEEASE